MLAFHMRTDDIYRQNVQQAVDSIDPGETLEIDADGLARAFPPDNILIKNAGDAFLIDQIDHWWGGITCEFISERNVYKIAKHEKGDN